MFDIGWAELLVIGMVALIAIGPKELPGVLRSLGHWMGKIRRMASDFQGQFQEAMREAEMADIKKDLEKVASDVPDFSKPFETTTFDGGALNETKPPEMPLAETPPSLPTPDADATAVMTSPEASPAHEASLPPEAAAPMLSPAKPLSTAAAKAGAPADSAADAAPRDAADAPKTESLQGRTA